MKTHQAIDRRSLAMAQAIVAKIDADPAHLGLEKARATCRRWHEKSPQHATAEWLEILQRSWPEVREILLDDTEEGARLRQNSPFAGILTPQERWAIYRAFHEED